MINEIKNQILTEKETNLNSDISTIENNSLTHSYDSTEIIRNPELRKIVCRKLAKILENYYLMNTSEA